MTAVTNVDRIRAMTDEELLNFIYRIKPCPDTMSCDSDPNWHGSCFDCWKNWMQEEAGSDQ